MTKEEFITAVNAAAKRHGFTKKGSHFYLDCGNDWLCVLGIQKSNFGEYCYLEYGFAIGTVNPKMPFPKFSELNINCGRLAINGSSTLRYAVLCSEDVCSALSQILPDFVIAGRAGTAVVLERYVPRCHYIIGPATLQYLGLKSCPQPVYPESLWQ